MENKPKFHPNPKLKLMDKVREVLRYHHRDLVAGFGDVPLYYIIMRSMNSVLLAMSNRASRPPLAALEVFTGKLPFSKGIFPIRLDLNRIFCKVLSIIREGFLYYESDKKPLICPPSI